MPVIPSNAEIDDLFLGTGDGDAPAGLVEAARWKTVHRRLKHFLDLDRRGGTNRRRDGYPSGAGGPGPSGGVSRPVESAVMAMVKTVAGEDDDGPVGEGRFVEGVDKLRSNDERIWALVQRIARDVAAVEELLDLNDLLVDPSDVPAMATCELCALADRVAAMEHHTAIRKTYLKLTVDEYSVDLLDRPHRLCRWHYDRIYEKDGVVPTVEQCQRYRDRAAAHATVRDRRITSAKPRPVTTRHVLIRPMTPAAALLHIQQFHLVQVQALPKPIADELTADDGLPNALGWHYRLHDPADLNRDPAHAGHEHDWTKNGGGVR